MTKRKSRKKKRRILPLITVILVILAACASLYLVYDAGLIDDEVDAAVSFVKGFFEEETESVPEETLPVPDAPAIASEATIGITGDILIHQPVLNAAKQSDGTYDFSECFEAVSSYWSEVDYMIANLEVSVGAEGSYSGYPTFSTPASIVTALADAGVDCLLTANNHAYDTGESGLYRTIAAIEETGLDYTGTRASEDDSYVLIKDVNDIIFGMVCYTYDTRSSADAQKSLNGITMSDTAENLVNSFCYSDLESLYESVASDLAEMEEAGCDVTMVFIHWGDEYAESPNSYQTQIAQALADLGVDIIVGGHPHVVQEFDILTGENGNETLVLYSTGNALSNQRRSLISQESRGYTEDGVTIQFTYMKFNNGTVKLKEVYILPTWVELYDGVYSIVPLDYTIAAQDWAVYDVSEAEDSYNRTLGRLGSVYPSIRLELGNETVPESIS